MFWKLFWKEWNENLWKLLFSATASVVFIISLFSIRILPDIGNCVVISFIQVFVIPVVYSMDIFSGEISNKTIHLLFKIPVERWKLFFAKYLTSAIGIILIFLISGVLMEVLGHGREASVFFLLKINLPFGATALVLFTWFCPFGCQSRSEAASLAEMMCVFIGWGIVFFWAFMCNILWIYNIIPYSLIMMRLDDVRFIEMFLLQSLALAIALAIGCYRYVSIRRYL